MAKHTDWITWTVIGLILLGGLWLILEPIIWWTDMSELRLYVRVFLIMFAVATFAVLRLYNSIVSNTRFIIKLHELIRAVQTSMSSLERTTKSAANAMGSLRNATSSLEKTTKENSESVMVLSEKVKQIKTPTKK